ETRERRSAVSAPPIQSAWNEWTEVIGQIGRRQTMEPRKEFEASLAHLTRRRFLTSAGAAAAGVACALRLDALLDVKAAPLPSGLPAFPSAFGRLFPTLPPFAPDSDAVKAALMDIAK